MANKYFAKGEKITGKYMGADFTGTITSIRMHTVDSKRDVVFIHFDKPISIFDNSIREDVCIEVRANGDEANVTPGSQAYPCYIRHIETLKPENSAAHGFVVIMACIAIDEAQKEYAKTH